MAQVNISLMYDDVLPDLPGCPPLMALDALREAAIDLCEISRVYRADLTAITVLANTPTYAYAGMPTGTVVHEIIHGVFGTQEIMAKPPDDLAVLYAADWRTRTGTPIYLVGENERTVRVVPYPTADLTDTIKLWVALKPSQSTTVLEQRIVEEYRKEIAMGAMASLMASPKKPYTNETLAKDYDAKFNIACQIIGRRAMKGFTRARARVRARFI